MNRMQKHLKKIALSAAMVIAFGTYSAQAMIPLPVFDTGEIMSMVKQVGENVKQTAIKSAINMAITGNVSMKGFGAMGGALFADVKSSVAGYANGQLNNVMGSLQETAGAAISSAKGRGECMVKAKAARIQASQEYNKKCKDENKDDPSAQKKCLNDAKQSLKDLEKATVKQCEEEMNAAFAETSAEGKKDVAEDAKQAASDTMNSAKQGVLDKGKALASKGYNWAASKFKKKNKDGATQ